MIAGEDARLFLVYALISIGLYISFVMTNVIIDFYDAIVTKHQMETAILNAIAEGYKNSQK